MNEDDPPRVDEAEPGKMRRVRHIVSAKRCMWTSGQVPKMASAAALFRLAQLVFPGGAHGSDPG